MTPPAATPIKRHILTVGLEDYFHVGAFNRLIQRGQWYRFEPRFERNTLKTLDLLDRFGVRATFFVLGWVADHHPEIVREVARRGHDIASRGYYHRQVRHMTPTEFRDDLTRSREALEKATGVCVRGYRVADGWFWPRDLWALDALAEEGYLYDSSIAPFFRRFQSEPWRRFTHRHEHQGRVLWEFPVSTWPAFGWQVPIAGGNYFRQFPHWILKQAVAQWHRRYDAPFVMYFHVWELDPDQPRIAAAPMLTRVRHYRNLGKMTWILEDYLARYRFCSIAEYLGLPDSRQDVVETTSVATRILARTEPGTEVRGPSNVSTAKRDGPVTVVVPCFNEELVLPYLANTLRSVEKALQTDYALRFVFVDDGSTDGTWASLERIFGDRPDCLLLRHTRNRGVAAAVMSGIQAARGEIVASIDCDCTYDPHELRNMIPLLRDGVACVTASPYHQDGGVRNVPGWRLWLSRTASWLYRLVLHQQLATYTSCFRVYRRRAVVDVSLREEGFLGIAEMLGRLDLGGGRIVEYPTVLEVRVLGHSKMKVARTILGHLRLLARLAALRMTGSAGAIPPARALLPPPPVKSESATKGAQIR